MHTLMQASLVQYRLGSKCAELATPHTGEQAL